MAIKPETSRRFTRISRTPDGRQPTAFRSGQEMMFSAAIHNLSPEEYEPLRNHRSSEFLMVFLGRVRGRGNTTPPEELLKMPTYANTHPSRFEMKPLIELPDWAKQEYEALVNELKQMRKSIAKKLNGIKKDKKDQAHLNLNI